MLNGCELLLNALATDPAMPAGAPAQHPGRARRIVVIGGGLPSSETYAALAVFREALRRFGYEDGRDVAVEYLWPADREDPIRHFLDEFRALPLDVVVLWGERSLAAVRNLRPQPPTVFLLYNEPRLGLHIASFERPGGRMTGVTATTPTLLTEQVRLLRQAVPHAARLAILWDPSDPGSVRAFSDAFTAAGAAGLRGHGVEARDVGAVAPALAAAVEADVDALLVVASAVSLGHVSRVVDVARHHRLPAIYPFQEFAEAGGLMSYGASFHHLVRRTAGYVDRLLRGARPGEVPVERPTRLDLVVNLATARALGLAVPPALVLRADRVIE